MLEPPDEAGATPICHWLWEMIKATRFFGNPRFYANWADEDMNQVIAGIARAVHPRNFAASVIKRYVVMFLLRGAVP